MTNRRKYSKSKLEREDTNGSQTFFWKTSPKKHVSVIICWVNLLSCFCVWSAKNGPKASSSECVFLCCGF